MQGNMPGLPQIIQNSMPVELPRASFQQNSISLFFGNIKRNQLVKATKAEAEIARYSREAVQDKLETIHSIVSFSARVADTLGQYEHNKTLRSLEVREKEADIYIKTAQAQQMGFEAKLSEIDYNIKLKQYNEMMKEE
jgi:hypothetical protein